MESNLILNCPDYVQYLRDYYWIDFWTTMAIIGGILLCFGAGIWLMKLLIDRY